MLKKIPKMKKTCKQWRMCGVLRSKEWSK